MTGVFVTGTDTGVGKTWVSLALLEGWRRLGLRTAAMKPVAAGWDDAGSNEDERALRAAASCVGEARWTCPFSYPAPMAPHLAAAAGEAFALGPVVQAQRHWQGQAERLLMEGAGGVMVPLRVDTDPVLDMLGLMRACRLPVILVVGLRLGCLNHARLSELALLHAGLPVLGWVANALEPEGMAGEDENVATLQRLLHAPLLARMPWSGSGPSAEQVRSLTATVESRLQLLPAGSWGPMLG